MLGRHDAGLCVMHSAQVSLSRGPQRCLCIHRRVVGVWVLLGPLLLAVLHAAEATLWIKEWRWLAVISDGQQLDMSWGAGRLRAAGCL